MKKLLYFSFAAICCASLSGCSMKESTIRQPDRFPKLITQIRTEHLLGDVSISNYLYDDQQRLKQVLTTHIDKNTEVVSDLCEFTYDNGRIEVGTNEGRTYTILLNEAGYAREITSEGKTIAAYHYNDSGYYYEPEMDGGAWTDYQYLLAGDRCNLAKILKYGGAHSPETPSLNFRSTFEYGDLPNNANLNLSYLLLKESHSSNTYVLTPMLFDWGGKRDSNLPKVRNTQSNGVSPTTEINYTYDYATDGEGNIVRITEKIGSGQIVKTFSITYR